MATPEMVTRRALFGLIAGAAASLATAPVLARAYGANGYMTRRRRQAWRPAPFRSDQAIKPRAPEEPRGNGLVLALVVVGGAILGGVGTWAALRTPNGDRNE